ncbi:MAG: hypothetical protein QXU06_03550 [Candidatus Bathyarchaeia archaeon]
MGKGGPTVGELASHGIMAAMIAGSLLFFIIALSDPPLLDAFTDYSVAILSFLPVASGSILTRRYGPDSIFGRCFALLTAGLALWFLGEALWPIHTRVLGIEMPSPSIMDVLWMAGYIFIGLGIYSMLKMFWPASGPRRRAVIIASCFVAVASAIVLILAPQIYEASPLELFIYEYYLISDAILLGLLSILYRTFKGGRVSRAWLILAVGLTAISLADAFFNLATSLGSGAHLLFSDLIYMNGYSLIALGFVEHAKEL